ncbi:contractile injection system protein, VgrG/Pvc8 family [Ralstonia sp. 1138]|uniref:phage late control D family protein n=1 Tax=Ralstonia sp. 1138 TaxID=3156423 RepID=UPI0033975DD5
MSLNKLPVIAGVRQPRSIVKVGGERIPACVSWSVLSNSYEQADTFQITLATAALPPDRDANWFSGQRELLVEIFAGFPSNPMQYNEANLESLIYGRVDGVELDPVSAQLTLSGRDLTALFIDEKVTLQFQNLTASEVAARLASAHGLQVAGPPTKQRIGKAYAHDNVSLTHQQTEWDLLAALARAEGFICYVAGKTLHFEPRPPAAAEPYELRWGRDEKGNAQANTATLQLSRDLTVAKGVTVEARSWNAKQGKRFSARYTNAPGGDQGQKPTHTVERNGLDQAGVKRLAKQKYDEVAQHEMKLRARLPADQILTPTDTLRLTGTGTGFDQDYLIDSITRSMSLSEGYVMDISAKNINKGTST